LTNRLGPAHGQGGRTTAKEEEEAPRNHLLRCSGGRAAQGAGRAACQCANVPDKVRTPPVLFVELVCSDKRISQSQGKSRPANALAKAVDRLFDDDDDDGDDDGDNTNSGEEDDLDDIESRRIRELVGMAEPGVGGGTEKKGKGSGPRYTQKEVLFVT